MQSYLPMKTMTKTLQKNANLAKYALSFFGAGLLSYFFAYYTTIVLSSKGCSHEIISLSTAIMKDASFFFSNMCLYSLCYWPEYTTFQHWLKEMKTLIVSNSFGLVTSFICLTFMHYFLMTCGWNPVLSFLVIYISAGLLGSLVKFSYDFSNGLVLRSMYSAQ